MDIISILMHIVAIVACFYIGYKTAETTQKQKDGYKITMITIKIGPKQDPKRAIQKLKNKLINEGLFVELKKRKHYLKPSLKKKLKREEAAKQRTKDFHKAVRKAEQQDSW